MEGTSSLFVKLLVAPYLKFKLSNLISPQQQQFATGDKVSTTMFRMAAIISYIIQMLQFF